MRGVFCSEKRNLTAQKSAKSSDPDRIHVYAVKLVQVVSIVVIVPEIYKLHIFLGAESFKDVVGAEGLTVESI